MQPVEGLSMALPQKPVRGDDVHAKAIARLRTARADRDRLSDEGESAHGRPAKRTAAVAVAEANEHVAAREAWVHYIEQGY
jgi:hypothetical protein